MVGAAITNKSAMNPITGKWERVNYNLTEGKTDQTHQVKCKYHRCLSPYRRRDIQRPVESIAHFAHDVMRCGGIIYACIY